MGCDIHLHVEVKVYGTWEHYAQLRPPRDYRLFSVMAGVRDYDYKPIAPPRGIPDDVSALTRLNCDAWNGDGHSHSWINADEIVDLEEAYSELYPGNCCGLEDWIGTYLYGDSFAGFVRYPEDRPKFIEDLRFVFWFDN